MSDNIEMSDVESELLMRIIKIEKDLAKLIELLTCDDCDCEEE